MYIKLFKFLNNIQLFYFIRNLLRKIIMNINSSSLDENMKNFQEYVFSFYGEGGVEDIGASKEQIYQATLKVFEYCLDSGESDVQGPFTSDLTLIKEILINEYKLKSLH